MKKCVFNFTVKLGLVESWTVKTLTSSMMTYAPLIYCRLAALLKGEVSRTCLFAHVLNNNFTETLRLCRRLIKSIYSLSFCWTTQWNELNFKLELRLFRRLNYQWLDLLVDNWLERNLTAELRLCGILKYQNFSSCRMADTWVICCIIDASLIV